MRYLVVLLTGCLGPNIVDAHDNGKTRWGTVWFNGRAGYGSVTAADVEDRRLEAEHEIAKFCRDAGFAVKDRRFDDGVTRDNFIDFGCGVDAGTP